MIIIDIVAWAITTIVCWESLKLIFKAKKKEMNIEIKKERERWHSNDVY